MSASVDRLRRLSTLLDEAMELDPPGLSRWLEQLGADDLALRATLDTGRRERAGVETADLLSRGPMLTSMASAADEADSEFAAGDRVGPYRLERPIGRGGMGEVWLAQRDDGQLARAVALKLPTLGARRSVLAQRFARERDIVGSLAHPNIARLYDAGVAADGQPFLALEYVEGTAITEHVHLHAPGLKARVELLLQVIGAVQYAHANLVIHRDIKPSNVLVTGEGRTMLLDFGIAKLLQEESGDAPETELTRLGGRAMTLHYAAPEQVSGAPISIATDVWALGVLAYELLANERPFSGTQRALEQAILGDDPPRPPGLPSDLATIVLKALKKTPLERYATADAMAADLRRWRDGEAVLAQPDTAWYRARKFVARNRIGVTVGAAFVVVVLAASGVSLWQANEARRQSRIAQSEARTAQAVQEFLEQLFNANTSNQPDPAAARQKTAQALLDEGAARIDGALLDQPRAKLRILAVLATLYGDMSDQARQNAMARKRVDLANRAFPGPTVERIEALAALSAVLMSSAQQTEAQSTLDQARELLRLDPTLDRARLVQAQMGIVEFFARNFDPAGLDEATQLVQWLETQPPSEDLVGALHMRGVLERMAGHHEQALQSQRAALAAEQRVPGGVAGGLGVIHLELARAQVALGDLEGAEASHRTALRLTEANIGPMSSHTLTQMQFLAELLSFTGRPSAALTLVDVVCERLSRLDDSRTLERSQSALGIAIVALDAHVRMGRPEQALAALGSIRRLQTMPVDEPRINFQLGLAEARALVALGRLDAADVLLRKARTLRDARSMKGPSLGVALGRVEVEIALASGDVERAARAWSSLGGSAPKGVRASLDARLAQARGDLAAAEANALEGLALLAGRDAELQAPYSRFSLQTTLAAARLGQSRPKDALAPLQEALAWNAPASDASMSPDRLSALVLLGEAQAALGKPALARAAFEEAQAIRARHKTLGPQYEEPLARLADKLQARPVG